MNKLISFSVSVFLLLVMASSCTKDDPQPAGEPNTNSVQVDSELGDLLERTSNNNSNDPIDCIDFVYPITFFIYDSNQQQTGTQTVNNDTELLTFLLSLDGNTYIEIDFPINVVLQDGTVVEVNGNAELVALIMDCASNGGNGVPGDFVDILTSGSWFVTYFFDDEDETGDFAGYEFTFATDNSAQATNGTNTIGGTWNLTNSNTPDLNLYFGEADPFDELDEDWDIIEATQDIIKLKHISGGDGSVDFLTFERTPNGGGGGGNLPEFVDNLTTDVWYVNLMDDDGDNETCHYVAYQFQFNANQTVTATSTDNTVNGTWSATNSGNGIDLILNFEVTGEDDPFDELNDDWDVAQFDAQIIELIDVSGGNGDTDYLTFGRTPYEGCSGGGNTSELVNILTDGQWYVQSYIDDGDDETNDYNGYVLGFYANGTVTAENGSNTNNGTWSVVAGSNGLEVILDFGVSIPFDEFNDDWDVDTYTTTRVELADVSGGNGGNDYLTFQKL